MFLTFPAYHAKAEKMRMSRKSMPRTSLNVKPFSLLPAVSNVTPCYRTDRYNTVGSGSIKINSSSSGTGGILTVLGINSSITAAVVAVEILLS